MLDELKQIIYEYVDDKGIVIDENTVLVADLGLSSLDLVDMACTAEDRFHIQIPDRIIKDFRTVGDVVRYIEKQTGSFISEGEEGK